MGRISLKPTDELIILAQRGNGLAFTALWDRHIEQLRSYIKARFKNIDDYVADDICSRSFEKAFRQIQHYDQYKSRFLTWLCTIAKNTALDTIEQEQRVHPKNQIVYLDDENKPSGVEVIPDQAEDALNSLIKIENEEERAEISYAFGNDIGYNISQSGMPIQLVWIGQAMQDVRDGKAKMTEDEVNQYLQYYFMVKRPAENAAASKAWLEKTEKKSGVKKTESGLLYKVTKEGDAAKMAKDPRDVVRVHYTGYTREGKVFDTSIFKNRSKEQQEMMRKQSPDSFDEKGAPKEADEPAKFPLNRVIKGWTEGLQLVGEGGKITLWIPSDLAYGTRGAGCDIGPNEALQFDVEVIEVIPYEEPAPADSTATTPAPAPAK